MTTVIAHGWRWAAGPDGVAHATRPRGRQTRALCDVPAVEDRWARPITGYCLRCEAYVRAARPVGDLGRPPISP